MYFKKCDYDSLRPQKTMKIKKKFENAFINSVKKNYTKIIRVLQIDNLLLGSNKCKWKQQYVNKAFAKVRSILLIRDRESDYSFQSIAA